MPVERKKPSSPAVVWKKYLPVAASEDWAQVLNAPGVFDSCDVWFQVPAAAADTQLRLFALSGPIKVPLWEGRLADAHAIWKAQAGGYWSGILCSIRNRQCDGFLLEAASPAGLVQQQSWRMECWWAGGGTPSDDASWIQVDPWAIGTDANRAKLYTYRSPPGGAPLGVVVPLTDYPNGRYDLIYASVTSADAQREMTLQTNDGAVVTNVLNWILGTTKEWYYTGPALPGADGARWEWISHPAAAGYYSLLFQFRLNPAYPGV